MAPRLAILLLGSCFVTACSGSKTAAQPGAGTDASVPTQDVALCGGELSYLPLPADPSAPGPWKVGSRGVSVAGLDAEVWYPALPGSADGQDLFTYDLRKYLPAAQQATVTDASTIHEPCDCYRDLPIDDGHGPYPLILFLHGFSGFSAQSVVQMTHWASRGFVVLAADHPSIGLATLLANGIGGVDLSALGGTSCDLATAPTQTHEATGVLDALQDPADDLAFLAGRVDTTRIGVAGHSAGGFGVSALSQYPSVQVVVPMAGAGVCAGPSLRSSLVMGAMKDSIVAYTTQQNGFGTTPTPKRLVGLANAGHMAFTAFCPIGKDQGGILQAAQNAGVVFDPSFLALVGPLASDGCADGALAPERGFEVIDFATAGVFEETLLCLSERTSALAELEQRYPDAVGDFLEDGVVGAE